MDHVKRSDEQIKVLIALPFVWLEDNPGGLTMGKMRWGIGGLQRHRADVRIKFDRKEE